MSVGTAVGSLVGTSLVGRSPVGMAVGTLLGGPLGGAVGVAEVGDVLLPLLDLQALRPPSTATTPRVATAVRAVLRVRAERCTVGLLRGVWAADSQDLITHEGDLPVGRET
jgi:hypothetical protein